MKKLIFISSFVIAAVICICLSCRQQKPPAEKQIALRLLAQTDSFIALKDRLLQAAQSNTADAAQLRTLFLQTRTAYKKIEWATEYFSPVNSRFVNGPPVREVELTGGLVFEPAGLQVIEGILYPAYDTAQRKLLIQQLRSLQPRCEKYKAYFSNIDILNWQVFDAARLELFRIMTLGITGFDAPLSLQSIPEAATALQSLQQIMACYTPPQDSSRLQETMAAAVRYLARDTAFASFDRAAFITAYANPVTIAIADAERRSKMHIIRYNRLLSQDAKTLFDSNAFNVNAYAPDQSSFITTEKVALGKLLFADPVLSGARMRSCQSCHRPENAFTDGLVRNVALSNGNPLRRNTPTLLNAALQPAQFADLRSNTLEDQSLSVVQNRDEMHGSMKGAAVTLWRDTAYRRLFAAAFPRPGRTSIDTLEVMNAIGSYVRSLTKLNSRFDDYMRGNKTAMSNEEVQGFNLFTGKAKCATCHYMPLFNGTAPPTYITIESEVIGVPATLAGTAIDTDMGTYNIMQDPSLKNAFKTSTVRNAAHTAPYMHNGVFTTLDQVLDFYNKGGGRGLGLKIENQTLPFDKLNLTPQESNAIIAFIGSLDSN